MLHTLLFFSPKCRLFHNSTFFGSCVIHILYTECAKIKKKKSSAKGLRDIQREYLDFLEDEVLKLLCCSLYLKTFRNS